MSLGLGLGLKLGNPILNQNRTATTPNVRDTLVAAIGDSKFVTFTYDGESLTLAPLVIYELDGIMYLDGFLADHTGHGNRPPALTPFVEGDISQTQITADSFSVHPRLWATLGRYENVKCIVQRVEQSA